MTQKQQEKQKNDARKTYEKIWFLAMKTADETTNPAYDFYKKTREQAKKICDKTEYTAYKSYQKKIKDIDNQTISDILIKE